MLNRLLFFMIVSLSLAVNLCGQKGPQRQLLKSIDSLISRRLPAIAPGAVVLIARQDQLVYHKAFGIADLKTNTRVKKEMIFRLGSVGKQFTAVAILQLVEAGRLSLLDSVQKFIKDYPSYGATVTIENLLSHTSGIKNYFEINIADEDSIINRYTPKQVVDLFKNEPLLFVPGSRFQYSNSNYFLLGYIIEQVTGKNYKDYLQSNVLDKAELSSTHYIDPSRKDLQRATGYSRFNGKQEDAELESINLTYAAGGLEGTVSDLFKWHEALYNKEIISESSLKKATTAFRLSDGSMSDYGYGWYLKKIDELQTVEHSGSTDGFQTDVIYLPQENIFVATVFNCYEADMDWQVLSNDIVRTLAGKPLGSAVKLTEEELELYVGLYEVFAGTVRHQMSVTRQGGRLFVEALNPNDKLPKVELFAEAYDKFYIKEAQLRFEFVKLAQDGPYSLVTYNSRGKDAEWKKVSH